MNRRFRFIVALLVIGFVASLTGCAREPQQRQAFIGFLQKEVIPHSSGISEPTKTMRKKFGIYSSHYDVIVSYNVAILEKVVKPLEKLQREYAEAMKPEADAKKRREAIVKYQEALKPIALAFDKEFSSVEADIAGLNQPDDLRAVYDQAVEKFIRAPAKNLKTLIPAIDEILSKNLVLLDFIISHKGKIEIKEGMIQIQIKDQSVLPKLSEMQAEISRMGTAVQTQGGESRQPSGQ